MGLLDGMMGNASKIDNAKIQAEFDKILAPGEVVEHAYPIAAPHERFDDIRADEPGPAGNQEQALCHERISPAKCGQSP